LKYFSITILLLVAFFGAHPLYAQKEGQALVDSLLKELPDAKDDTNKIKMLVKITYYYVGRDPDLALKYGQEALELSKTHAWRNGMFSALQGIAGSYLTKSNYPTALENYFESLKIAEEAGDKRRMAAGLSNIGLAYGQEGDLPHALEYDLKGLKLHEELGNLQNAANTLGNIGNIYASQSDFTKALEYDTKAMKLCEEIGNQEGVTRNLANIGSIYRKLHDYPKALATDLEAEKMSDKWSDKHGIAVVLGEIGTCYFEMASDTARSKQPGHEISADKAGLLRKAIEYLSKSLSLSKEIGFLEGVIDYGRVYSDALMLSGDCNSAFESYKEFTTAKDSVYSTTSKIKIANLETNRQLTIRDKQIQIDKLEIAQKHNERIYFIGGMGLLLLVISVMARNYALQKKSNRLLTAEKKRSEDLLLNILPAEVAEELKEKGSAVAKYFDSVTVMFTDFVGFTKAGETMGPQQLVDELDTCFKAFDDIITKNKIEKIKTVGDAYLAVSGLPVADPEHARRTVNAALEIRQFMAERKMKLGSSTFEVRIGIHSGSVVAGIVGIKKFSYDIWGDTVNTAARMEQNCEAGKVNISETTYQQVKDQFACTYRGEIDAKNKGMLKMYFVEAEV
jgi:adenylate cyclase